MRTTPPGCCCRSSALGGGAYAAARLSCMYCHDECARRRWAPTYGAPGTPGFGVLKRSPGCCGTGAAASASRGGPPRWYGGLVPTCLLGLAGIARLRCLPQPGTLNPCPPTLLKPCPRYRSRPGGGALAPEQRELLAHLSLRVVELLKVIADWIIHHQWRCNGMYLINAIVIIMGAPVAAHGGAAQGDWIIHQSSSSGAMQ